jgi:hypothetical protein
LERKVRDREGIEWTCVQAYAGVAQTAAAGAAAEAADRTVSGEGTVPVVCTPSGAEATVRLELPKEWAEGMSDEELLRALAEARRQR